jgi:hypothetical protein
MATIIVNSNVWIRIKEYYENVEDKYPNTWDINDTLAQINKIQLVISNFESVCTWNREPIISYWKSMGWKETWNRVCPWHFAFEYNRADEKDYILIQDTEHQNNIKESCNNKHKIIDNNKYKSNNIMKQKIVLKESDLHRIVKESVEQVVNEGDFLDALSTNKMLKKASPHTQKMVAMFSDLRDVLNEMGKYAKQQGIWSYSTPSSKYVKGRQHSEIKDTIQRMLLDVDTLENTWGKHLYRTDKNYKSRPEFQLP